MPGRREKFERGKCLHHQNSGLHSGLKNFAYTPTEVISMNN